MLLAGIMGTTWFVILIGFVSFFAGVALCPKIRKWMGMNCPYKNK